MRPMRGNPGALGIYHPCHQCGSLVAPFGVEVAITKGKFGRWYCAEHVPADFWERQ